jgi:GNAT superfamily N-acetyltransferase
MTITIRAATGADREALFGLLEAFATSFTPERPVFEAALDHLLADEAACLRVAEVAGQVVGYCLAFDHLALYANGRVTWIEEIMVQADFRRQGIGRALMAACEDWARARGAKLIALATRRAAAFYTALGYAESAVYFRKLL